MMSEIIERYDRAMALKEGGDLESAVEELNGIVADEPDHVLSHSALAVFRESWDGWRMRWRMPSGLPNWIPRIHSRGHSWP